jgi:hypothetical protein
MAAEAPAPDSSQAVDALSAALSSVRISPQEEHDRRCHALTRKGKRCRNRYGKCQYLGHAEYRKAQNWSHPALTKDPCDETKLLAFCKRCSARRTTESKTN